MRPYQQAFDQPEFIHHLQGQGMHGVAAKIAEKSGAELFAWCCPGSRINLRDEHQA